jgi:L-alanine-DL-glutamate epimerase-like enolase superfamily enzyme
VGESYPTDEAHMGALRELAPMLIGKDASRIERLWQEIYYRISYQPWGGAEFRMLTAINIAQWGHPRQGGRPPALSPPRRQGAG